MHENLFYFRQRVVQRAIGLVTLTLHLNHNTPLRTLINVPIVKEILLDCMIVDFDDTDYHRDRRGHISLWKFPVSNNGILG
jgi:hypothetical protein